MGLGWLMAGAGSGSLGCFSFAQAQAGGGPGPCRLQLLDEIGDVRLR